MNTARRITSLLLALTCSALAADRPVQAQSLPDQPRDHVVDLAGVIDREDYQRLDRVLTELQQKTGAQVIALTVKSTDNVPIEDFALQVAGRWKLGMKGKDNGVLVVVAVRDRRYRIEVGYGLEGVLPDGAVGRIGRESFVPYFRKNQYGQGIYAGTLDIAQRIAQEANVTLDGMPKRSSAARRSGRNRGGSAFCVTIGVILLIMMIAGSTRRRRGRRGGSGSGDGWFWAMLAAQALSNRRGRSSGWGGGGSGGSFGGGGGGSFGGGGASGSW